MFLPVEKISKEFSKLIEEYPINPYLDNRESFVRWMHFIHNKVNDKLEKPNISLNEFFIKYYEEYKTQNEKNNQYYKWRNKIIYIFTIILLLGIIYYLYDK